MTMLVGEKSRFAIEADPESPADGWVLGRFRFWVGGRAIGDWDDAADLKSCVRWLRDFVDTPRNRFQPGLMRRTAQEVFDLVFDSVVATTAPGTPSVPAIEDAFSRFHISHLGMSSFDMFDVLLVTDEEGNERCLWRHGDVGTIEEGTMPPGEMERVAALFCEQFESGEGP